MAFSDDAGVQPALADSRRQAAEATRSLRRLAAQLAVERDRFKAESAQRRQELARLARAGGLGPDQERLQRRVDAGETTWADIASGRDAHPAAVAARSHLEQSLTALREQLEEDEEFLEADVEARAAQLRVARPAG